MRSPVRQFEIGRVRSGELAAGFCGALLLVSIFALKWYALKSALSRAASGLGAKSSYSSRAASGLGAKSSYSGWAALTRLRHLLLLTGVAAIALTWLQGRRREPAIPATLSVFVTLLGGASALALLYRVLLDPPGPAPGLDRRAGAYVGLIAAIGIALGGYRSMRTEQGSEIDPDRIETVRLG